MVKSMKKTMTSSAKKKHVKKLMKPKKLKKPMKLKKLKNPKTDSRLYALFATFDGSRFNQLVGCYTTKQKAKSAIIKCLRYCKEKPYSNYQIEQSQAAIRKVEAGELKMTKQKYQRYVGYEVNFTFGKTRQNDDYKVGLSAVAVTPKVKRTSGSTIYAAFEDGQYPKIVGIHTTKEETNKALQEAILKHDGEHKKSPDGTGVTPDTVFKKDKNECIDVVVDWEAVFYPIGEIVSFQSRFHAQKLTLDVTRKYAWKKNLETALGKLK